jgi:hypothetical protein
MKHVSERQRRLFNLWRAGNSNQGINVRQPTNTSSRQMLRRTGFVTRCRELTAEFGFNMSRKVRRRIAWDSWLKGVQMTRLPLIWEPAVESEHDRMAEWAEFSYRAGWFTKAEEWWGRSGMVAAAIGGVVVGMLAGAVAAGVIWLLRYAAEMVE